MKHALIIMFFLTSSCSFRAIYPAVGAGVGSFKADHLVTGPLMDYNYGWHEPPPVE